MIEIEIQEPDEDFDNYSLTIRWGLAENLYQGVDFPELERNFYEFYQEYQHLFKNELSMSQGSLIIVEDKETAERLYKIAQRKFNNIIV